MTLEWIDYIDDEPHLIAVALVHNTRWQVYVDRYYHGTIGSQQGEIVANIHPDSILKPDNIEVLKRMFLEHERF